MFAPTLDAPARKFRGDPPIASARHDVVIDLRRALSAVISEVDDYWPTAGNESLPAIDSTNGN